MPTEAGVGSYPRRLGQAFVQLLEAFDPTRLPVHGGDATTVVVTIPLEQLRADLGRAQRLVTAAQRRAFLLRDCTCRAHGCDIPGTWTEAHHWIPWSHGGKTDLDNAVLLCHLHHHRTHDPTWHPERLPNGDVRFTRRT